MAVKTYYLASGQDNSWAAMVDGTVQTAATRADGWTVAKIAAANSCEFNAATKQASGSFSTQSGTPKPMSLVVGTPWNTIKSPAALTGTFAAAAFTLTFAVRATTASSQAGRMRLRVFKSVNATGASATELTAATQVGTTSAALSTTADVTSVVTWTPAAPIVLNNEYLFFSIAWEITTASGSNSGDVQLRTGSAATPTGTVLVTSNWVPLVARPIPPSSNVAATSTVGGSLQKYVTLKQIASANVAATSTASATPSNLPPIIDDFNRADGAVYAGAGSAIWSNHQLASTALSNCVVSGNRLGSTTTSGSYQGTCVSLATVPGDFDLLFDCVVSSTGQGLAFYFCLTKSDTSSWNGMSIGYDSGGGAWWGTYYLNGGAQSLGNTPGVMPVAGETYKISKRGTAVSFYKATSANGPFTLINTWTTTTDYGNPGAFGLDIYDTTQRWDNVRGSAAVIPPAILDDFNRADGAVYAGAGAAIWRTNRIGSLALTPGAISSNQLMATANSSIITALVTTSDFDMMWDCVNTLGSSDIVTFYFCLTNETTSVWNGAGIGFSSGTWYGTTYANGSGSAWVSFGGSLPQAGETYWIRKRGTAFTFSKATSPSGPWTTIGTGTFPGGLGAGSVGIGPAQTTQRWDNLRAGKMLVYTPVPATQISATSTVGGTLSPLRGLPIGFVPSFSSYGAGGYGQDPYGGQQVNGITVLSVKPVAPVQINATSTVSGAITAQKRVTPTQVSATSTVVATVGAVRSIKPTVNVAATSTVNGSLRVLRAVLPAGISATSTVSGSVRALRKIAPVTAIAATSTMSGFVRALRKIAPAQISATSTVAGSLRILRRVAPTQINATSTVATVPLTVRRKIAGLVNATSTVSGSISKLSGGPKPIVVTSISATSTVTVTITKAPIKTITGNIAATSVVSARISALRVIGGSIPYNLGPIYYEADGLYSASLAVDLSGTNAVTLIFKADYQGGDGFGGLLFEYTPNINATNNGFWVTPGSEWGTVGAAETANKYPDGGYNVSEFDRPSNGPHTWCVVVDRSVGVNPTKVWIDGVSHPVATYNGFADASTDNFPNDVLYVGHRYGGGADLNGGVSMPLVYPYAFTDANAQLASTGLAAGVGIAATSTVGGSLTKFSGGPKPITPVQITATSTMSAVAVTKGPVKSLIGNVAAASTVSGFVRALRKVVITQINATSTLSGIVRTLRKISGQINAVSTIAGSIVVLRRIAPTGIAATSTVNANVRALHRVAGQINAISTTSGLIAKAPTKPVTGNVTATSTVTGLIRALRKIAPVNIAATSTVSGSVAEIHKLVSTQISATSSVTGSLATHPVKIIGGANISATSVVNGSIRLLRVIPLTQISAISTISGRVVTLHKIVPAQISATSVVSNSIVKGPIKTIAGNILATSSVSGTVTKGAGGLRPLPTVQINAASTISTNVVRLKPVVPSNITAISNVNARVVSLRFLAPVQVFGNSGLAVLVTTRRRVSGQITATSVITAAVIRKIRIGPLFIYAVSTVSVTITRVERPANKTSPGRIVHAETGRVTFASMTTNIIVVMPAGRVTHAANMTGRIELSRKGRVQV